MTVMKVFVQISDISDDRFPGEELLDQRIILLRLLMEKTNYFPEILL